MYILYFYFSLMVVISIPLRDKYRKTTVCGFKFGIKNHSTNQQGVFKFGISTIWRILLDWMNRVFAKTSLTFFAFTFCKRRREDSIVNILLLLSFIGKKVWKMLCGKKELPYQKCLFKKVLICLEKSLKFMKKYWDIFQAKKNLPQISQFNGVIRYP